jgi:hypothetical protein
MAEHDGMTDPVNVSFLTNVDQQRDTMTDKDWADLGRFVADVAANIRQSRDRARTGETSVPEGTVPRQ